MRFCLLAGTFNPIHNVHLKMAEFVIDNYGFDKVIFIPAFKPPHKDSDNNMSFHRLEMVKLAIRNNPKFEVCDIEFKRNKKSYTYDTILELRKIYGNNRKFSFIIGTDAFLKIESWYKTNELKNMIDFIVFIRQNEIVNFENLKDYNFKLTNMDFIDISSTEIRNRIKKSKSISEMVTKEVEDYIYRNGLYKN